MRQRAKAKMPATRLALGRSERSLCSVGRLKPGPYTGALALRWGQLCGFFGAADTASGSCGELRRAGIQNLVILIHNGQQRVPHNAYLRTGFIACGQPEVTDLLIGDVDVIALGPP